jgi:Ca-activated chloride channel family protein
MNARKYALILSIFVLLVSACAPQRSATQIAGATNPPVQELDQGQAVVITQEVMVERPAQAEGQSQPFLPPAVEMPAQPPVAGAPEQQPVIIYPTAVPESFPPPGIKSTPVDNFFQDYGVNSYTDALEDHLSTFALDVDTASYSVARRYVMDGMLPPADAVRVEEFVNYFDPGYQASPYVAFAVYADGAPSPFHYDGTYFLRFGVQGYQVQEWQRKPATLTFVIDISGSMQRENRLELVKRSLELLVDRLNNQDTVAIVVYGSYARTVLNPTPGSERQAILNAIYSLYTEGATNAEAGLELGYQLAMQAYRQGSSNRVVLCSDGVANVGATSPDAILAKVRGYVEEGVTLTTVGFGMGNFNDVLMEQLADNGDGHYAYVDDLDEAHKLFVEDLTSTLQVIARDAKVQVDFNPDVVSYYRLVGYENRAVADQDFRNDSIDAGELGAGHSATAIYAVQFRPGAQGRVATVQLRWQDPDSYQVNEINGNLNTWDLSPEFNSASPHYRLAVLAAQYAEVLRGSPWAADISIAQIYNLAAPLPQEISWDQEVSEFVHLLSRAGQMRW